MGFGILCGSSLKLVFIIYFMKVRISGARVILVSALPNDARLIHQIAKELKMVGKGWIWLGSDGATILNFPDNSEISKKMAGMLGVNPKGGEGSSYLEFLSAWAKKDKLKYPGIIHTAGVGDPCFTNG